MCRVNRSLRAESCDQCLSIRPSGFGGFQQASFDDQFKMNQLRNFLVLVLICAISLTWNAIGGACATAPSPSPTPTPSPPPVVPSQYFEASEGNFD